MASYFSMRSLQGYVGKDIFCSEIIWNSLMQNDSRNTLFGAKKKKEKKEETVLHSISKLSTLFFFEK